MKSAFTKIKIDIPTIKEMEWDIRAFKTAKEVFEYLEESFFLYDELQDSISTNDLERTQVVSNILFAFKHMSERIDTRIDVLERKIAGIKNTESKENENEDCILN